MYNVIVLPTANRFSSSIISTLAVIADVLPDKVRCSVWNPAIKPAFDMFDEVRPDFIFADDFSVPYMGKALEENPNTKLVVLNQPFNVHNLPVTMFCVPPDTSSILLRNIDEPYIKIEPAANLAQFNRGEFIEKYNVDILYFAASQIPKDGELELLSILSSSPLTFRIIGYGRPFINYVGHPDNKTISNYMRSAKVVLDIDEQTLFDVAIQHGLCISNKENAFYPSLTDEKDTILQQFIDIVENYKDYEGSIEVANKHILCNDTYCYTFTTFCI